MIVGPQPVGVSEFLGGGFQFAQPWPNPAGRMMHFEFHLREGGTVTAEVLDVTGRRVSSLLRDEVLPPGIHRLAWDGRDGSGVHVAPGIYLVRVTSGSSAAVRRVVWFQ